MSSKRRNRLKISGGSLAGRFIQFADNAQLRPTTERSREAIFSILDNLGVVSESICLDLYAGSGVLGIEALSRGAKEVHFVESSRKSASAIEENLKLFSLSERSMVWPKRVESFVQQAEIEKPITLLLADPPYDFNFAKEHIGPLVTRGLCADTLHLVLERRRVKRKEDEELGSNFLGPINEEGKPLVFFSCYSLISRQLRVYGDSEFEIIELKKG